MCIKMWVNTFCQTGVCLSLSVSLSPTHSLFCLPSTSFVSHLTVAKMRKHMAKNSNLIAKLNALPLDRQSDRQTDIDNSFDWWTRVDISFTPCEPLMLCLFFNSFDTDTWHFVSIVAVVVVVVVVVALSTPFGHLPKLFFNTVE